MVFEGMVGLGIALLLAPAIAEYAKLRHKADKGFAWLAVAGVFFLFASSFAVATKVGGYIDPSLATWGAIGSLFEVIGWILALIGTLFVGYEVLLEK
ncbi:MAG: hypothetical protein ACE5J3_10805 [Methanosarcinales archaeon]